MSWLRGLIPKRSPWAKRQFDTLRLRLLKLGARIVEKKTKITVHFPATCPDQGLIRLTMTRLGTLAWAQPGSS